MCQFSDFSFFLPLSYPILDKDSMPKNAIATINQCPDNERSEEITRMKQESDFLEQIKLSNSNDSINKIGDFGVRETI